MQHRRPVTAWIATIVGLTVLFGSTGWTQTSAPPATAPSGALGRACNTLGDLLPADPNHPGQRKRLPIDETTKSEILHSGLPCAETVDTNGPDLTGLQNLQHGFDFISWRTFIALNSPADGTNVDIEHSQPDTPTQWEDMKNFKQLLDVMLPSGMTPKWPDTEKSKGRRKAQADARRLRAAVQDRHDGHQDDRGDVQSAVQDRPPDRPGRALRAVRHPDEQGDVRLHLREASLQ
jgi:hypothetical protein